MSEGPDHPTGAASATGEADANERDEIPRRWRNRRNVFGLHQGPRHQGGQANPQHYEQKYADDDKYGEELGPNARFWRVFLDEGQIYDIEMVDGWRDTLDVLLVFAGLFSGVVTTLVVQSSTGLQPDYAQISVSLMAELLAVQRAWASGLPIDQVPRSQIALDAVSASALDYWCNGFWYFSLSLSLSAALMAVLVKQWLQAYTSNVSGTPKHQALIRQYRLIGIERWNVPLIVSLLPMLLHLSVLLFFVGLALYIFTLDTAIAVVIVLIAVTIYSLYLASIILPTLDPQCPYKTPMSQYGHAALQYVLAGVTRWVSRLGPDDTLPRPNPSSGCPSVVQRWWAVVCKGVMRRHSESPDTPAEADPATQRSREATAVAQCETTLVVECLNWIYSTSSNPSVATVTVQAVCGLPHDAPTIVNNRLLGDIISRAEQEANSFRGLGQFQLSDLPDVRGRVRLIRSLLFFGPIYGCPLTIVAGYGHLHEKLIHDGLHKMPNFGLVESDAGITELQATLLALSSVSGSTVADRSIGGYWDPLYRLPLIRHQLYDLRLPGAVWKHMLGLFVHGDGQVMINRLLPLAVSIWEASESSSEGALSTTSVTMTLSTLRTTTSNSAQLIKHAIHRLICDRSCTYRSCDSSKLSAHRSEQTGDRNSGGAWIDDDMILHLLRRALETIIDCNRRLKAAFESGDRRISLFCDHPLVDYGTSRETHWTRIYKEHVQFLAGHAHRLNRREPASGVRDLYPLFCEIASIFPPSEYQLWLSVCTAFPDEYDGPRGRYGARTLYNYRIVNDSRGVDSLPVGIA